MQPITQLEWPFPPLNVLMVFELYLPQVQQCKRYLITRVGRKGKATKLSSYILVTILTWEIVLV